MSMLHIWLIESHSDSAQLFQEIFLTRGHSVEVMPDGLVALAELERRPTVPHLILLRVELPRMSGYSVCNKIKRRTALRDIPLMLLSSQATPETFAQHKRLRTRANGYLSLPVKEPELWSLMEELIPNSSIPAKSTVIASRSYIEEQMRLARSERDEEAKPQHWSESFAEDSPPGTSPELVGIPDREVLLDDPEPSTGMLRAVDIIEEESVTQASLEALGDDDIHVDDESLELGFDDIEDSVDWGKGGLSLGSQSQMAQTMIPTREPLQGAKTTMVVVKRKTQEKPGTKPTVQNGKANGSSPSYTRPDASTRQEVNAAQNIQEMWGDAYQRRDDSVEVTIIAGQTSDGLEEESGLLHEDEDTISPDKKAKPLEESLDIVSDDMIMDVEPLDEGPTQRSEIYEPDEATQLSQRLKQLEEENRSLRETLASQPVGPNNSLSDFITQQLDEMEEMGDAHGSQVVLANVDTTFGADNAMALAEHDLLREEVGTLREQHKSQEEGFEQERQQWRDRLEELELLSQPDNMLQMQVSEYRMQLESLREEREDLFDEIARLRDTLQAKQQADQDDNLDATHDEPGREIAAVSEADESFLSELQSQLDEKTALLLDLGERLSELEEEHKEVVATEKEKSKLLDVRAEALLRLREQVDEQTQILSSHEESLESWEERFSDLEKEHENLQRTFQTKEVELEQLDEGNRDLHKRLEDREAEARELRAELAGFRAQFQGQTSTDDELLVQIAEKEKELQLLREDLNVLGEQFDTLETQHNELMPEHKRISEELQQRNNALLTLDDERNQLAETILEKEAEKGKQDESIKELNEQIKVLEGDLEALSEDLDGASQERNRYRDEMLQISNELDAAREELRNVRDREDVLREELEQFKRDNHRLEQELASSQGKLQHLGQGVEGLEEEVVMLRQKNVKLEQKQFEMLEQTTRFQNERDDLKRKVEAEQEGRKEQISRREEVEVHLQDLLLAKEEWQQHQKQWNTQRQDLERANVELRQELEDTVARYHSLLETEQALRDDHENSLQEHLRQVSEWHHKLQELEQSKDRVLADHQQELLDMQQDWEQDNQSAVERLRQELDAQWKSVLEEERQRHNEKQSDLLQSQEKLWKKQQEELVIAHEKALDELRTVQQIELERVRHEWSEEVSETRLVHRTEIEQIQQELQQQHGNMLDQLEEDNRRLRKEARNLEQQFRGERMEREEEHRLVLEQATEDAEKKATLRYQAIIEGLELREAELETQVSSIMREQSNHRLGQEEMEVEMEHLKGQVADLETLRKHERNEIHRLKKEREHQEHTLQQRIDELEEALQERRSQTNELYQRLKKQESQRENTAHALRDALSLLGGAGNRSAGQSAETQSEREEQVIAEIAKLAKLDF